jgi:serine/threonine protein kinase
MFLDEARICARIRHPNVVPTLDVFARNGELFLVMEYVEGESVAQLLRASQSKGQIPPPSIVASIVSGMLHGLHAAHEAKSDRGEPLDIVHRDVSPQNVLVGTDGSARVVDFGVAKALGRLHTTREGAVKGKLAYMAPEQIEGATVTRSADLFAAAAVLWEALTTQRLFQAENEARRMHMILHEPVRLPSEIAPNIPAELDAVVIRGLERKSSERYASALEMAEALERAIRLATPREVGVWVRSLSAERLTNRALCVAGVESLSPSEAALRSVEPHVRPDDVGADDFTVQDAASRTQASSISVSKSRVPGNEENGTRRPGPRMGLAMAAAVVLIGVFLVRFALTTATIPVERVGASSAGASAAAPTTSERPVTSASAEPTSIALAVSAFTPDASPAGEPAPRQPAKHAPRPKKAIYSRE